MNKRSQKFRLQTDPAWAEQRGTDLYALAALSVFYEEVLADNQEAHIDLRYREMLSAAPEARIEAFKLALQVRYAMASELIPLRSQLNSMPASMVMVTHHMPLPDHIMAKLSFIRPLGGAALDRYYGLPQALGILQGITQRQGIFMPGVSLKPHASIPKRQIA